MKKQINYKKLGVIISIVFGILGSGFGLKAIYSAVKICDLPEKIEAQKKEFNEKIKEQDIRIDCVEKSQNDQELAFARFMGSFEVMKDDVSDIKNFLMKKTRGVV